MNEFVGGPWDSRVTDCSRPTIFVISNFYPYYTERLELDGPEGDVTIDVPDLERPSRYVEGFYRLRRVGLNSVSYTWVELEKRTRG